ncbi:MAG: hypothetical protein KIT09_26570 [Bryobacteraceae bacterium]|nr:hypothetical protein [Bryobacteraceae bacterium]
MRTLALVGVFALLSITTFAVSQSVLHSGKPAHNCKFCQLSQLPWIAGCDSVDFSVPEVFVALAPGDEAASESEFFLDGQPPRAPPA